RRPARLTRDHFQVDNFPPTHDRRKHVWLVAGAEKRLVTDGPFDEHDVAWHPSGDRLAFISARHDDRGTYPGNQVFEVGVAGGDVQALVTDVGFFHSVGYDTTGTPHAVGILDAWDHPGVGAIHRFEGDEVVDLTGHLDRDPLPYSVTVAPKGPRFTKDGFVTVLEDDGRVVIVRSAAGFERVVDGDLVVTGVDAGEDGLVYAASTPTSPGELYWHDGESSRRLTDLNGQLEGLFIAPEQFTVESDGVELTAWVYLPPGVDKVPVLFNIHGGPASQYGVGFFDEFQMYAGAGYGVVACNPRGSSGRGRDFVRAVVGTWATDDPPDLRDLNAVLAASLEKFDRLDADRVGVMGGSYGGWATAQLISRDNSSYRSAVVERGVTSWTSFWGTSDIGPWFGKMYLGTELADDWDGHLRASPMTNAHKITTPTLVLHSQSDWRTPLEQGLQLFTMLAHNDVPSELVRFPDEGHELSRSGKPRHRIERFEAILDWHGRYL
ncbi:MAG: S9 family peptidase, partial [Acidimicrobiia bacterium]|nr:S9 family peptidase [Acidimicrobiia bacterium]